MRRRKKKCTFTTVKNGNKVKGTLQFCEGVNCSSHFRIYWKLPRRYIYISFQKTIELNQKRRKTYGKIKFQFLQCSSPLAQCVQRETHSPRISHSLCVYIYIYIFFDARLFQGNFPYDAPTVISGGIASSTFHLQILWRNQNITNNKIKIAKVEALYLRAWESHREYRQNENKNLNNYNRNLGQYQRVKNTKILVLRFPLLMKKQVNWFKKKHTTNSKKTNSIN